MPHYKFKHFKQKRGHKQQKSYIIVSALLTCQSKTNVMIIPSSFPQMDFYKHMPGPDSLKKIEHKQLHVATVRNDGDLLEYIILALIYIFVGFLINKLVSHLSIF